MLNVIDIEIVLTVRFSLGIEIPLTTALVCKISEALFTYNKDSHWSSLDFISNGFSQKLSSQNYQTQSIQ